MMQDHNAEILEIAAPRDDSTIAEALAGLESKLADFTDAMRAAAAGMRSAVAGSASGDTAVPGLEKAGAKPEQAPIPPAETAGGAKPEPGRTVESSGHSMPSAGPAEPVPADAATVPKKKKGIVPMVPEASLPAQQVVEGDSPVSTGEDSAAAEPAAGTSRRDEDEALLASLDAETAAAIRVMRRVSVDNKSVSELLEEYRAGHKDAPQTGGDKKSWWTRGRR